MYCGAERLRMERLMSKVYPTAAALDDLLKDGQVIMSGGFGVSGIPDELIAVVRDSGVRGLTTISNNAQIDGVGLSILLESQQIKKMIIS
jgi:3-oxoacid CoA-transferase subunit A